MQFYYWCELKTMNVCWSSQLWFVHAVGTFISRAWW